MKTLFFIVCGIAWLAFWVFDFFSDSEENRQLNGLDDGLGVVYVNGEYLTRQEAKDAQSRGELYDTYY